MAIRINTKMEAALPPLPKVRGLRTEKIDNAIVRAEEFGQRIKNDAFMKEILYGYPGDDKHIAGKFGEPIIFVSDASKDGNARQRNCYSEVSEMPSNTQCRHLGEISRTNHDSLPMRVHQIHGTRTVNNIPSNSIFAEALARREQQDNQDNNDVFTPK